MLINFFRKVIVLKYTLALSVLGCISCTVALELEGPIDNTTPLVTPTDPFSPTPAASLANQNWRITQYRVGEMGQILQTNDTLRFISNTAYTFNDYSSTYSLSPTGSGFNLTLNETLWGNLSGTIMNQNLVSGSIPGVRFTNIALGSSNTTPYYLWIIRL